MICDVLLLAGGASRRMGRDKALLPLAGGRLLWQRQLAILRALEPAQVFFSGPARPGLPPDVVMLSDAAPGLGPLSGLAAGLGATKSALLVVLAVDLPKMTSACLADLLAQCAPGRGAVPKHGRGYEPLAAVYPQEARRCVEAALSAHHLSLQPLVQELLTAGLMREIPVGDESLFTNWNEGPEPGLG